MPLDAGSLGHGQLRAHARFQRHAVIARLGMFGGEALAIPRIGIGERARSQLDLTARRHHQHVEHVTDPGARQMRMAEPHDRRVGAVIARTRIPALDIGVGAELHHPERQRRTRIGVAMTAGADEQIGRRRLERSGGEGDARGQRERTATGE